MRFLTGVETVVIAVVSDVVVSAVVVSFVFAVVVPVVTCVASSGKTEKRHRNGSNMSRI